MIVALLCFVVGNNPFKIGHQPTLSIHLETVTCAIRKIKEIVGRNNAVIEANPSEICTGQTAIVEFEAEREFSAETMFDYPRLSRFVIKANCVVVALGFIRANL